MRRIAPIRALTVLTNQRRDRKPLGLIFTSDYINISRSSRLLHQNNFQIPRKMSTEEETKVVESGDAEATAAATEKKPAARKKKTKEAKPPAKKLAAAPRKRTTSSHPPYEEVPDSILDLIRFTDL